MRYRKPGSVQAELVLYTCSYILLAPGWAFKLCFWDFFSPNNLADCLQSCSVTTEEIAGVTLFPMAATPNHKCAQICRLSQRFFSRFGCYPPSVLLSSSLTQSKLMKEPMTHKIKTTDCKKGTGLAEVLQDFHNFSFAVLLFSVHDSCGLILVNNPCGFQPGRVR